MRAGVQPAPSSGGTQPGFGLDDSRRQNVILTIVDSKNKNKKLTGQDHEKGFILFLKIFICYHLLACIQDKEEKVGAGIKVGGHKYTGFRLQEK